MAVSTAEIERLKKIYNTGFQSDKYADYMDPNMMAGGDAGGYTEPTTSYAFKKTPLKKRTVPIAGDPKLADYMDSEMQSGNEYTAPNVVPKYVAPGFNQAGQRLNPDGSVMQEELDKVYDQSAYVPKIPTVTPPEGDGDETPFIDPNKFFSNGDGDGSDGDGSDGDGEDFNPFTSEQNIQDLISEYYGLARESSISTLQKGYTEKMRLLDEQESGIGPRYAEEKNEVDTMHRINARKLQELMGFQGIGEGDYLKKNSSMLAQRLGDNARLNRQETGEYDKLATDRRNLSSDLITDIGIAETNSNMEMVGAIIDQYNKDRDFAIKESGTTGWYGGKPTMEMLKTQLSAEQWNVEMQVRVDEFNAKHKLNVAEYSLKEYEVYAKLALQEKEIGISEYNAILREAELNAKNDPNSLDNQIKNAEFEELLIDIQKKSDDLVANSPWMKDIKEQIEQQFYMSVMSGGKYISQINPDKAHLIGPYIERQVEDGVIRPEDGEALKAVYNVPKKYAPKSAGGSLYGDTTTGAQVFAKNITDELERHKDTEIETNIGNFEVGPFEQEFVTQTQQEALTWLETNKEFIVETLGKGSYFWYNRWKAMANNLESYEPPEMQQLPRTP